MFQEIPASIRRDCPKYASLRSVLQDGVEPPSTEILTGADQHARDNQQGKRDEAVGESEQHECQSHGCHSSRQAERAERGTVEGNAGGQHEQADPDTEEHVPLKHCRQLVRADTQSGSEDRKDEGHDDTGDGGRNDAEIVG